MSRAVVVEVHKKRAHFVFIPLMAQGHIIPAIDTAFLVCRLQQGAVCSIMATPWTADRVRPSIEQSGLDVRLVEFPLEYVADGADNLDNMGPERMVGYFAAVKLLEAPMEEHLRKEKEPRVTCIVSDVCHPWTSKLAASLGVPRLVFFSMSAFSALWEHDAHSTFTVAAEKAWRLDLDELGAGRTPSLFREPAIWGTLGEDIDKALASSDGLIINTFMELESAFVRGLAAAWNKKVWTVGPVSLYHDQQQPINRGSAATILDESRSRQLLCWLDGQEPGSVVYASFGTIAPRMEPHQVLELALGLEGSGHPFIWVLSKADHPFADSSPLFQDLEARVAASDKGRILKGWAPQLLILSHAAVGCFLTHSGWNSILETITAGTPVVTWPRLPGSDHYVTEKLAVEVLGIGLSIAPPPGARSEMELEISCREVIQGAITSVLAAGEPEAQERRRRVRALAHQARAAMQPGGSSHANLCHLANRFAV